MNPLCQHGLDLLTQSLNVWTVPLIFDSIELTAAQRDACSPSCSTIIRTTRVWTPGENLFVVLFIMALLSQELEPPAIPGRFNPLVLRTSAFVHGDNSARSRQGSGVHVQC